jgi:hypothetical protein
MRISRAALVWGVTLILLGALLFAQQQRLISVPVPFWAWVLGGLGVLFLLTALTNLALWGMFFPGFILLGLGVVVFLTTSTSVAGNVVGSVFLASVALPFWVIALVRRANWWAIIPAGAITVLAIMPLLAETNSSAQVVGGVFFLGLGATFGLVRLATIGRRGTGWAWYPALILGGIGLVILASGDPQVWPLALIGLGLLLMIRAFLPRRRPSSEPEAKG